MNFEKITNYLDSLKEKGIPSVDCMISEDHKVLYRHSYGAREDQRYLIFSMTKIQTMTAVMQLIEQGKISLEDEVSKFLPAYRNLTIAPDGTKATIPLKMKHLMSMQSGLDYDLNRPGIMRVLAEKGKEATTREIVDSFIETPLLFEPGTHFCYSLSHDVVAAVIEVVSGMKFSEYLKKNIWEPLEFQDTFFASPMNDSVERLLQQYIFDDKTGAITPMDQSCCYQLSDAYESGGAGLISCTEDYMKLGDTLAGGGISAAGVRILKPETVEIIKQNLLGEASRKDLSTTMGRTAYGYGCGMQVFLNPELTNSPAPKGVFGWDGAAGSCLIMDTVSKRSLVFMMHVRNCGPAYGIIHPRLRDMLF